MSIPHSMLMHKGMCGYWIPTFKRITITREIKKKEVKKEKCVKSEADILVKMLEEQFRE